MTTTVGAETLREIELGKIVTELRKMDGQQRGRVDTQTLSECAARLDRLTASRMDFLSERYKPLRAVLRKGFESTKVRIHSDAHLFDETRRLLKNIKRSGKKSRAREKACAVCTELDYLVESLEQQN